MPQRSRARRISCATCSTAPTSTYGWRGRQPGSGRPPVRRGPRSLLPAASARQASSIRSLSWWQPKLKTKPHPSRHTCHLPCSADHNLSHATQTGMESRARSSRTVEREKADAKIFAGAYRNDLLTTFNGDSGDCNTRAPQHTSRQPRPQRSICAFWAFWIH